MTITTTFLDQQRKRGDEDADLFIQNILSAGDKSQLYETIALTDNEVAKLSEPNPVALFLTTQRPKPAWYSTDAIDSGQQVFKKYALDIMTLLGVLSLPYCYAASPGNKALYLTAKMRKSTGKRLVETADFIINVMSPGSFDKAGAGHVQINRIRLVHAMVRYYLQKGEWNAAWGIPINQEDMAGTNLAFSYIILTGLTRTAFKLTVPEQENFLHVWRYIGYQMHIAGELLPASVAEARQLENKIKQRHFQSSEEGRVLTKELVHHYTSYFPAVPGYFVGAQMRYLLGPEVSSLLGLQPEKIKDELTKSLNAIVETVNQLYVNPSGFEKMLANHAKLKKQFA
jgi:hypothetical protein